MLQDPVAREIRPRYYAVDILAVRTVAWGRKDRSDMLADRASDEANAGGVQELVSPDIVSILLSSMLRCIRPN